MSINTSFIGELKHESGNTRKLLERVPLDSPSWLPHEKSMTIGRLATHIAELPVWVARILSADEFDFAAHTFKSHAASGQQELMQIFPSVTRCVFLDKTICSKCSWSACCASADKG